MIKRLLLLIFGILVIVSGVYALRDQRKVTTSSEKAYKSYLSGVDLIHKLYNREAIAEFETAVKLDSNFAMAIGRLAVLNATYLGNKEKADSLFKKAIVLFPKIKEKERMIISIEEASSKGELARFDSLRAAFIAKYPDCLETHEFLAGQYQMAKDYEMAIQEYQKILKADPNYAFAYNMMAYLNYYLRNYDLAIDNVKKYVMIAADEANPHDSYGELLMNLGKYDEAIEQFNIANKIKPDLYFVLMHLASAYYQTGRVRDAFGYIERARDKAISQSNIENCDMNIIGIYWEFGEYDKALALIQKLLEKDPGNIRALNNRGVLMTLKGNLQSAKADLEKIDKLMEKYKINDSTMSSTELKEGAKMARNQLAGMIAMKEGDAQTAISTLQEQADNTYLPGRLWQRDFLGLAYTNLGNYAKARDVYIQNLQDNPNHGLTLRLLADLYGVLKQPENQKETLLRFLSVMSGADEDLKVVKEARAQLDRLLQVQ
jgi:tetratricopeptide (TPR) repeat protein